MRHFHSNYLRWAALAKEVEVIDGYVRRGRRANDDTRAVWGLLEGGHDMK